LSPEERRKWDELAKLDRKRCREEHENSLQAAAQDYSKNHNFSTPAFLEEVDNNLNQHTALKKPSASSTNAITVKLNNKKQRNNSKDPKLPKKNVSAYIHFCNVKRKELKILHPTANICELGKLLGLEYKKISDSERQKYDGMAREDKIRFDNEMQQYQSRVDIEEEELNLMSLFRARPP